MNRLFFLLVLLPNLFGKHQQAYVSAKNLKNINADFSVLANDRDGFPQEEVSFNNLLSLLDLNLFSFPSFAKNQNVKNTFYRLAFDKKLSYNSAIHFICYTSQANQSFVFFNNQLLKCIYTDKTSFKKQVPFLINDA